MNDRTYNLQTKMSIQMMVPSQFFGKEVARKELSSGSEESEDSDGPGGEEAEMNPDEQWDI